jgi:serine/threonine-protein kinase
VIGQRINNYEITALLGEGGMGSVYLAEHPVLGRKAAVKLLRPEYALDENLVGRFINEARASSAIHHPGIIEVFDVGTLPEGQPYLMMELLEGETLARRIHRAGRLRVPEAIDVTVQAAAALGAAHGHGIVHRDLKPDNMFLVPDPTQRCGQRVKVLDFGIAKLHRRWSGERVRTHTGSLMGTPPYMSPEQCRGISSEIDHRTDVYALGIILYEMLVGAPPFLSEGFGDVLLMHLTKAPVPPRQIDPAIPTPLEAVVLQALEKDPDLRFSGMEELARALAGGPARNTVLEVAPPPAATRLTGRGRGGTAGRLRPQTPAGLEPSTTFSSSVGQMAAVRLPYARSTVHIRSRRQAIAALLGAGLAGAAAIAFFMNGGFRPRPPRSAGPAAVESPAQPPAPATAGSEAPPPAATETPAAAATETPPAVAGKAPPASHVVVPAIPDEAAPPTKVVVPAVPDEAAAREAKVVVPKVPDQPLRVPEIARPDENAPAPGQVPARLPRTRKARGRDITGTRGFSPVPDPPPLDAPPAPARKVAPPPPAVVPPPPTPSKPRVNTEKW